MVLYCSNDYQCNEYVPVQPEPVTTITVSFILVNTLSRKRNITVQEDGQWVNVTAVLQEIYHARTPSGNNSRTEPMFREDAIFREKISETYIIWQLRKCWEKLAIRTVQGIGLDRQQSQNWNYFQKRPVFLHTCATCSELPSNFE